MEEKELELQLSRLLAPQKILVGKAASRAYDCDAYTLQKQYPQAVVFPESTREVQTVVRWCIQNRIPFTPRGAGTGLSGGAVPVQGGVIVSLTRMRQILEIDIENQVMLAQAGCPNLLLTRAVERHGLHFAPDPSSQTVCTLGGNINENSGGPHTLKYGVTTDHVTGITFVDTNGEIRNFGGKVAGFPGLDLVGIVVGSEGTLGITTEAWVRLTPLPNHVRTVLLSFGTPLEATQCVSNIIASGIIPAALEFMDGHVIHAVEEAFHTGLPQNAGALLLIECDGNTERVEIEINTCIEIAKKIGAFRIDIANDSATRSKLWIARKRGIGALGRLSPSLITHDGVIPRSKLPDMLAFVYDTAKQHDLRVANIFHAGDGNLHPIFLFDERDARQVNSVIKAGEAILRKCIQEGGSVTGEHGIGVEKIDLMNQMFNPHDLKLQDDIRFAINDNNLCNPGKVLPSQKSCVEIRLRNRAIPV